MNNSIRCDRKICCFYVLAVACAGARQLSGAAEASERIRASHLTLVIYNHAGVEQNVLADAENITSKIFRDAEVQLIWRDGFSYTAERQNAAARAPESPATLVVRLQPASEAGRYGVRSVCGGIGVPSGAIIFVRSFDSMWLGYAMAHEIGHMILGSNAHSLVGIMRGTLLKEDWTKAAQGTLGFTRSQNNQIQKWIVKRTHQGKVPATRSTGDPARQIRVHVYNVAATSAELLRLSEMNTSRIFIRAGIELTWMDEVVWAKDVRNNPDEQPSWDSMDLGLRIYTCAMVPAAVFEKKTLGFVLAPGTQAIILLDRIRDFASYTESPMEFVLGAALAHEIFHLLTENNAHSRKGVMQAVWSQADMQAAAHGSLSFTLTEEDQLRGEINKRAQQNTGTASHRALDADFVRRAQCCH